MHKVKLIFSIGIIFFSVHSIAEPQIKISILTVKPWGYLNEINQVAGLGADFATLLEQELEKQGADFTVSVQLRPYLRVIHEIKTGKTDLAIFPAIMAHRKLGEFAKSIGNLTQLPIVIASLVGIEPITDVSELNGKSVGIIRGSLFHDDLENYKDISRVYLRDINHGMSMLFARRIHSIIGSEYAILAALAGLELDVDEISVIKVIGSIQTDLYMSKLSENKDKSVLISNALRKLRDNGKLTNLFYPNNTLRHLYP